MGFSNEIIGLSLLNAWDWEHVRRGDIRTRDCCLVSQLALFLCMRLHIAIIQSKNYRIKCLWKICCIIKYWVSQCIVHHFISKKDGVSVWFHALKETNVIVFFFVFPQMPCSSSSHKLVCLGDQSIPSLLNEFIKFRLILWSWPYRFFFSFSCFFFKIDIPMVPFPYWFL